MMRSSQFVASLAAFVFAVLGVWVGLAPVGAHQAQPPPAQQEFVPVEQLSQAEAIPAAPLVVAAYAFVWVVLFGYLWSVWRRLSRVERELADVAKRLAASKRSE